MISDVVYEQIVKKKYESKDYLKCALYIFLCVAVSTLLSYIIVYFTGIMMMGFIVLIYIAAIFLAVGLIRNTSYEYEYIFVNGELTIDKILAKTSRKRMLSFDVKLVEDMGIYEPQKFAGNRDVTTLVYSDTYAGEGDLYMDFRHPSIGRTVLVIKSDDRLAKALKPYVKRHIHKAVFPDA